MKHYALLACLAALYFSQASAQNVVPVKSKSNLSGTITSSGTFQNIQGQTSRYGCTIQNNGTHTMYVYFGPIGSASVASAASLGAGQSVNCSVSGNTTLSDQVSITGTAGDAYYANFQ